MPTAKGTDPRQTVQKIPLNLSELIESWGDIKHGILGKPLQRRFISAAQI